MITEILKSFLEQIKEMIHEPFAIFLYILTALIFILVFYITVKKVNKEKKELENMLNISNAHTRMVVENSQNLSKFFEDLALIPVEMLNDQELADLIEKKLVIRNHDIFRFLKINEFLNRLDSVKRKIVFQLLVNSLLKRPGYTMGSLIFRSIIENELEAKSILFDILNYSVSDTYRQEVYHSVNKYLNKYLRKEKSLSKSARDKFISEAKKIQELV